ncbi:SDR family NAD(P)-dependent oxidoreductase [Streptomyces iranensis]|uniref:NAD(P)-dependent dehydrogenase (Short-subunit alcohol dehydrogenase family) n=1 Tax=Streptomyces iranensis TaxID=576784 RepID=A0A060ZGT6_9ACTN|nr:SDR family NAD(P)-dependent oxidoreductase [Streptomyces iranensis]MBP2066428.1 NAD(P)-dependent dehydrogenase (short-subunit alcohol dehydrogenase family) [Streptomyces iranensis]CDR05240.1 short-chain dehydrogenase/reductase SDR [Streptomyces iranensis]
MAETTGLEGQVAIVTGAGSRGDGIGNGRAAAVLLARRGARVALVDNVAGWAETTRSMIEAAGGTSLVVEADVADPASCSSCVARVLERWGEVNILVNNVGVGGPAGDVVDVDPADWERCHRTNLTSMMLMSKYCVPPMRRAGGGSIVHVSSVAGLHGGHPNIAYPVTKGAIVPLTRAMAAHHGAEGIRVNAVAPGMVYTPMVATRPGMTEAVRETRRGRSLLGTEGSGWDVGEAVAFLAGRRAAWITGVVLPVDAGATAGRREFSPNLRSPAER